MKNIVYSVVVIVIVLIAYIALSFYEKHDNRFTKLKLQNNYEFRKTLQRFLTIEVDSLDNLIGEKYNFDTRTRYSVYENSKVWSIFYSDEKEILKNKNYYREVIKKDDKQFFLDKIKEISILNNANAFIEINNLENVDCFFHYGVDNTSRRDASMRYLNILIYDKVTNYYYFGRYTGELVEDSVVADFIEILPSWNFKHFEFPTSDVTDIHGKEILVPFKGKYRYLKFKNDKAIVWKHKHIFTKYTQKEKHALKNISKWYTDVSKNHSLRNEFEKVTFDTCYYRSYDWKNRIYLEWLAYDKKSKYYYYGECDGIKGAYKHIYEPFLYLSN
ncbi:MAG: hypothetical protein PF638_09750 [Candidatus Delongbacteria bacterium]|jgi:hypothetical protein|nr:hypothetical protein [Candidatus Delongbacteria bacterium]